MIDKKLGKRKIPFDDEDEDEDLQFK